jgi:hypothetical protein
LISREVICQFIRSTTTTSGLEVRCCLDENEYPKAIKVSDAEMAAINISRDDFHGEWNLYGALFVKPALGSFPISLFGRLATISSSRPGFRTGRRAQ